MWTTVLHKNRMDVHTVFIAESASVGSLCITKERVCEVNVGVLDRPWYCPALAAAAVINPIGCYGCC